ncbi:inositol 2-dehydrogenase [Flavihumibacter profundi]|uniref:inositol 2-dehydrogenase n=1 Tax=Flavihumibacter profundi TaxID=2716883 RepID=UPI001CC38502|nr:inositol 2-dehydrogenase [Flavihumibacter profundi]MBZ5858041.1 inositol 2-dehydrogenase [Flavihumibacter profundi]
MKKVNIAILGIGRIGKIHLKNMLRHFSGVNVVAVADVNFPADEFKKEFRDIFFSSQPADVVSIPEVEAIVICTPTSSHAAMIEMAVKAGKHIFCEKPVDLSLERTRALVEMAKAAGVKLMLGFNRRFDPDFMEARKNIQAGRIGDIQVVKITSRDPGLPPLDYIKNSGGLFMDMAIHDFDMARYMMGKEVKEVYSKGLVLVDKQVADAGDIDTALTTLVFEDGTYAVIDNSRKAIYGYDQRIEIFGNKGMIQVDNNLHNRNIISDANGIHHALPLDFFMDRYAASYLGEMQHFIDALSNNAPLPVTGEDGLKATVIAVAAKKSVAEGRPVLISEIK